MVWIIDFAVMLVLGSFFFDLFPGNLPFAFAIGLVGLGYGLEAYNEYMGQVRGS